MEVLHMSNDFDPREAINTWRNQSTAGFTITPDEMRSRVARTKTAARRQQTVGLIAVVLNLLLTYTYHVFGDNPDIKPYAIWLSVGQVVCWLIFAITQTSLIYKVSQRYITTLDLTARPHPCLDFYSRTLQLRRDHYGRGLFVTPTLGLLGLLAALFASKSQHAPTILGVGVSLAIFSAAWFIHLKRAIPRIELEIHELDAFRRTQET
jgi:hypothetical protein